MFFIFIKCLQVFLINIFILDILYNTKVSVFNPQRYNNLYDGNLNLFNNDNKTIYELNYLKNLINTTNSKITNINPSYKINFIS